MPGDDRQAALQREIFMRALSVGTFSAGFARQASRTMRDAHFRKGEVIFAQGTASGLIHFLVTGAAEMVLDGAPAHRISAPGVIGMLDLLARRPHTRTAVAVADVHALALREDDWADTLEEYFDAARGTILRLAGDLQRLHLACPPTGGFPEVPAGPVAPPSSGLDLVERTLALRGVRVLLGATVQALARLSLGAGEITLAPGEILHRAGEPASSLYLVTGGVVAIEHLGPLVRARQAPGQLVGGAASLSLTEHGYTAVAESAAVLLEIRREDFFDVVEDHSEMIRAVLAGITAEIEIVRELAAARTDGASTPVAAWLAPLRAATKDPPTEDPAP